MLLRFSGKRWPRYPPRRQASPQGAATRGVTETRKWRRLRRFTGKLLRLMQRSFGMLRRLFGGIGLTTRLRSA